MDPNILNGKIYLIITIWDFPYGGGEEFMYQTTEWADRLGMKSYWINFSNSSNLNHGSFSIATHPTCKIIRIPGGFDSGNCSKWIKLIKPDIVHHQGHMREKIFFACNDLRVSFLTGFHFWTGGLILDYDKMNRDILENKQYHKIDPELGRLFKQSLCTFYCASAFVQQCIKEIAQIDIPYIILPASSRKKYYADDIDIMLNKYVSAINIHKLKGGEILLYLLKNCPNIPFCFVKTDLNSDELDMQIENEIKLRPDCILMNRVDNPIIIYKQTKIMLCPGLVDETFCRVVNESMMNGIPTLTSGQGNMKYLIGDSNPIIKSDDYAQWKNIIEDIYHDSKKLLDLSEKSRKQYEENSETRAFEQFSTITKQVISESKEYNVMIFSPWCDQGLGIQSREYYNILSSQFNVSIFAVKPYIADSCIELQKNPAEWNVEHVHYSPNDREHVQDDEIIKFVKKYNIGKCIIPETCWFRVFEVIKLLNNLNVKTYAVPNIEIVRKDEIFKHTYLHKILCNNNLCRDIFKKYGINQTEYIGYGMEWKTQSTNTNVSNEITKFIFIGGMNAFSRKNLHLIYEAFASVYKKYQNIQLTATIQKINALESETYDKIKNLSHPAINIILDHLSYSDIQKLYLESDVSIQVSKHEGLGLGFYEALSFGVPIITLDTPPHNEIIKDNINGLLVPPIYVPMVDNTSPNFDSAIFDPAKLAEKIEEILQKKIDKTELKKDFEERLSKNVFSKKFIEALNS